MAQEVVIGLGNAYIGGGGVQPSGNIDIDENGVHDVAGYATATIEVPGIVPTGNITITENGTGIDVTAYATATVNVNDYVSLITFDLNGGTGTAPDPRGTVTGCSIELPYGDGIVPPEGKSFVGWSLETDPRHWANPGSSFTPFGDATMYAIYR